MFTKSVFQTFKFTALFVVLLGSISTYVVPLKSWGEAVHGFTDDWAKQIPQADSTVLVQMLNDLMDQWTVGDWANEPTKSERVRLLKKWKVSIDDRSNISKLSKKDLWSLGHSPMANMMEFLAGSIILNDTGSYNDASLKAKTSCLLSFTKEAVDEKWRPIMVKAILDANTAMEIHDENLNLVPTSDQDASSQWADLRSNPKTKKGQVVTWKMKVTIISSGTYTAELQNYLTSVSLVPCKLTDDLHENDYVVVKGKFYGVNDDGYVVLKPLAVKNLGAQ